MGEPVSVHVHVVDDVPSPDNLCSPGVSITEAARALGVTREAIRQRIRRGRIHAAKIDGQWYVELDCPRISTGHMLGVDSAPVPPNTQPDSVPYSTFVTQLQGEIAFLREEVRRKDAIIARFAERLPALPEGRQDEPATPPPPRDEQKPKRRWWLW